MKVILFQIYFYYFFKQVGLKLMSLNYRFKKVKLTHSNEYNSLILIFEKNNFYLKLYLKPFSVP